MHGVGLLSLCVWISVSSKSLLTVNIRIILIADIRVVHTLHMTVVLFSTDIVMLVLGSSRHALGNSVLDSWLSLNGFDHWMLESSDAMDFLRVIRFHLENKFTVVDVGLGSTECCAVSIKGRVVRLVPSVGIESVEVISPVEIKGLRLNVVREGLDVIVLDVPGHGSCVQSLTP